MVSCRRRLEGEGRIEREEEDNDDDDEESKEEKEGGERLDEFVHPDVAEGDDGGVEDGSKHRLDKGTDHGQDIQGFCGISV